MSANTIHLNFTVHTFLFMLSRKSTRHEAHFHKTPESASCSSGLQLFPCTETIYSTSSNKILKKYTFSIFSITSVWTVNKLAAGFALCWAVHKLLTKSVCCLKSLNVPRYFYINTHEVEHAWEIFRCERSAANKAGMWLITAEVLVQGEQRYKSSGSPVNSSRISFTDCAGAECDRNDPGVYTSVWKIQTALVLMCTMMYITMKPNLNRPQDNTVEYLKY